MCRLGVVLLVTISACSSPPLTMLSRAGESQSEATADIPLLADQLIETFDLVLTNHLNPPTMQQMVQESIAAAYGKAHEKVPVELANEISRASADSLPEILRRELTSVATDGTDLSDCIPRGFRSLGVVLTPSKAQMVNDQIAANRYVGIGIAIMSAGHEFRMATVFPGGPASLAGAKAKDVIVKVDGKSTSGLKMTEVIEWIRGVKGSKVELVINRDGKDQSLTMTRDVVPFATVQPAVFTKSGRTVGIKLDRVSASSVHELRKIAAELDAMVETVVLDLRSASGVDILHYGELLGNALLDDATIGFVADRKGKRRKVVAEPGTIFSGRRIVAVIDGRTGGVLKWIVAALQESQQAITYGYPTAVPAVTSTTLALAGGSFSVTMPTHTLVRANGQTLALHGSDIGTASEQQIIREQRLNMELASDGNGIRAAGTLYPVKALPLLPTASGRKQPVVDPRLLRVERLAPMMELIEDADDVANESGNDT